MDIIIDLKDILNNYKNILNMYNNSIDILKKISVESNRKDSLEDKLYYAINNCYASYYNLLFIYDRCENIINNLKKKFFISIIELITIDIDIKSKNSLELSLKLDKDYYPSLYSCKKRILEKIKNINAYNIFIKGTKDTTIDLYILDGQYDVFSIIKNYLF